MASNAWNCATPNGEIARTPPAVARLLLAAAWCVGVALMLAVIAQVAQAQVKKGQDFQFAAPTTPLVAPEPYASRGGADVSDLEERVSAAGGLQTVRFTR